MAKADHAFRTISEAAEDIGAPQHVLRFWETKFSFIAPVKRAGGRRFYRPDDLILLKAVKRLLHEEGLTIKGVQRLHREQGVRAVAAWADPARRVDAPPAAPKPESSRIESTAGSVGASAPSRDEAAPRLRRLLADLEAARARLDAVLAS